MRFTNLHALFLLALTFVGCAAPTDGATGDVYADHEHAERPAHHPESFPAAVAGLRVRLAAAANGHGPSAAQAAEIVDWLPELAADSDLSEAEWAPLDDAATALRPLVPRVAAGDAAALAGANVILDDLAGLITEYGRERFEVVPHTAHDHHGHTHGPP